MVVLTEAEKRAMCQSLAEHLPKLRELLGVTQTELGWLCGFSRIRVSQIETGKTEMSWSQLTSIALVCFMNTRTKEYLCRNDVLGMEFLQFVQRIDENIPPDVNPTVREEILPERYRNPLFNKA